MLDLFEALANADDLKGWNGLGIAVQAYQKRGLPELHWLIDLARRSGPPHSGAAGERGVLGHRDQARPGSGACRLSRVHAQGGDRYVVSSPAPASCWRARDAIFPQFATHNAHTLSVVEVLAGGKGDYEYQRLHGMGESLYELYHEVRKPSSVGGRDAHLRAGRQPRGPARLSRAPLAGERRQHLLRQPHGGRRSAARNADRRSGHAIGQGNAAPQSPHPRAGGAVSPERKNSSGFLWSDPRRARRSLRRWATLCASRPWPRR